MRSFTRTSLAAIAVLTGSVALGGCATKGYVNDQIATVNQRIDGLDGRLRTVEGTSGQALAAAQAAAGQAQQNGQRIDQLNGPRRRARPAGPADAQPPASPARLSGSARGHGGSAEHRSDDGGTGFGSPAGACSPPPCSSPFRRPAGRPRAKSAAGKAASVKAKPAKKPAKPTAPVLPPEPVTSPEAGRMIDWVAAAHDNGSMPYIVIDKQQAALFLFDRKGKFLGQTPVLLGVGVGDDSTPGVGAKTLADIGPAERTTPAGRYVAKFGLAVGGAKVLWVDYANSVALHAVVTTHAKERRVERLKSPTPDDNRISFGCINVGTPFYSGKIRPLFAKGGVVYVMPDTRTLDEVFPRVRLLPYLRAQADSWYQGS